MVRIRDSLPTWLLLLLPLLWVQLAYTSQFQPGAASSSELPASVQQAAPEYVIPVEVRGYVSPPEGFSRHRHRPYSVSYSSSRSGVFDSVQSDSSIGHNIGGGSAERGEVELSTQETVRVEQQNVSQAMGDVGQEDAGNRTARFLSFRHSNSLSDRENFVEENEIASPKEEAPSAALKEIYSDCLLQLSFTCIQKKMLLFLDRLARMEKFSLIGDYLTVVRVTPDLPPPITERGLDIAAGNGGSVLDPLLGDLAERFFTTHVIRATLPAWVGRAQASGNTIDISLTTDQELTEEEGRKKKGGKKGGKKMKKMMTMIGGLVLAKIMLLLPLLLISAKLKAKAALLFSIIALVISKIQLIKKLTMMMKGGGGGDDSGGGGGGEEKHIYVVAQPNGGGHGGGGDSWSGGTGGGGGGAGGWSGGGGGGGGASDTYGPPSGGGGGGGGGGWSGGGGSGGWGRRMAGEVVSPHWLAYRGQIPAGLVV